MAQSFNVFGSAVLLVGGSTLGITTDGVEVTVTHITEDVPADNFGATPAQVQYMGMSARISAELVYFDQSVLNTAMDFGAGGLGLMGSVGTLIDIQNLKFALVVRSTPSGTGVAGTNPCYKFANCYLENVTYKFGTRKSTPRVEFRALPVYQSGISSGAALWTSSCS
jgi:hypothetical protein